MGEYLGILVSVSSNVYFSFNARVNLGRELVLIGREEGALNREGQGNGQERNLKEMFALLQETSFSVFVA